MRSVKTTQPDPLLEELRARVEAVVGGGRVTYKALAQSARMSQQTLKALREGRYATVRSGTTKGLDRALSLIEDAKEGLDEQVAAVVAEARLEMQEFLVRYAGLVAAAATRPRSADEIKAQASFDRMRDAVASQDGSLSEPLAKLPALEGKTGQPTRSARAPRAGRTRE